MGDTTLVGKQLDRYRIEAELGAGGMGAVYRARDTALKRDVALKVISRKRSADATWRRRFEREAQTAAQLSHPHIATTFEIGDVDGTLYIAMELVEGHSLRELLDPETPVEWVVAIARQVAEALAHAHQAGIVHRDLKPDNVMVTKGGEAKLLDFGLAKAFASPDSVDPMGPTETALTKDHILGTPHYMAPEQLDGRPVGPASDVFAFGVTLFEMLTGEVPFGGRTTAELAASILRDTPRSIRALRPELPASLVATIERCLEKNPADRLSDGRALADALATWRAQESPPRKSLALRPTEPVPVVDAGRPAQTPLLETAPKSASPAAADGWPPVARGGLAALAAVALVALLYAANRAPNVAAPAPSATASTPSPITSRHGVVACPIMKTEGVVEPAGWLGAAAASALCDRLDWHLVRENLSPAHLLGLPRTPINSEDPDPFVATEAREASVAAARDPERASAWLDGVVTKRGDGFALRVKLRSPTGMVLAEAQGEGALWRAVRQVHEAFLNAGAFPTEPVVDPELAPYFSRAAEDRAYFSDLSRAYAEHDPGLAEICTELPSRRDRLGWPHYAELGCVLHGAALSPHGYQGDTVPQLVRTILRDVDVPAPDAAADRLAKAAQEASSARVKAFIHMAEASLRVRLAEFERGQELLLEAMRRFPRLRGVWLAAVTGVMHTHAMGPTAATGTWWLPHEPDLWTFRGLAVHGSPADLLRLMRRGTTLAPYSPTVAADVVWASLSAGDREGARAVAARLRGLDGGVGIAGRIFGVWVLASETKLAEAARRAETLISSLNAFGGFLEQDHMLAVMVAQLSSMRNDPSLADAFVERFVLADPPRLVDPSVQTTWVLRSAVVACAVASEAVAARCGPRLAALRDGPELAPQSPGSGALLDGFLAWRRGEKKKAVEAWRPLAARISGVDILFLGPLLSPAFDEMDEPELADKLDALIIDQASIFGGATMAHVRSAERAARRGDASRARTLAAAVIDGWSTSDTRVPAVARMRALRDRLPEL